MRDCRGEWRPAIGSHVTDSFGHIYIVEDVESDSQGYDVLVREIGASHPMWLGSCLLQPEVS